jgi:hypothetical protein
VLREYEVSYAVWVVCCVVQLTRGEEESECVGVSDVNGLLFSCLAWVFVVVVCTPALSWSGGGVFQGGGEVFAGGRGCIGHSTAHSGSQQPQCGGGALVSGPALPSCLGWWRQLGLPRMLRPDNPKL